MSAVAVVLVGLVAAACDAGVLSAAAAAATAPGPRAAAPAVPATYRTLYATLQSNVAALAQRSGTGPVDPAVLPGGTVMAGELGLAAGNRGPALLRPGTLAQVDDELGGFTRMGMEGVVVVISYPMLLPGFPHAAAYLRFYEQVASLVAAHGMVLSVELNPAFPDPQLSSLHPDYHGLTEAAYAAGQRQEAQLVIDDVHPRTLTVLDEPSTFATTLRMPTLASAAGVTGLLDQELDGLDRDGTLVGAGIGTWEDTAIEQAIATQTSVDYLSVHVYPTAPSQLEALDQVTTIAADARKPLVIDETWLSKSNPSGPPPKGSAVTEQAIKNWSFWEPLDAAYLAAIAAYARAHGISMVSPFSTELFFANLPWTPARQAAGSATVRRQADAVALAAVQAGRLDQLGRAYAAVCGPPRAPSARRS